MSATRNEQFCGNLVLCSFSIIAVELCMYVGMRRR